MKKFVIVSDSCCDLNKELRERFDIEYLPMYVNYKGAEHKADLDWGEISPKEYYDMIRDGERVKTAQVTGIAYKEAFEKHINDGCDVLSISCSSSLSASVNASYKVRDELKEKYPDSKIICIDSVNACFGLGLLCIRASELRAEGKSIEEVAEWIMANRKTVNQECTVESLKYLKQSGRVSAASAFFGGILSVKPIIISDVKGQNTAVMKVKGRKNSIDKIFERFTQQYIDFNFQRICVTHADCEQEAIELKSRIEQFLGDKKIEIHLTNLGPIISSTTGPGTIAIYFYGKEVTFDHTAK